MLDFTTSTSVSDGINWWGKSVRELHDNKGWRRREKPRTAGGGRGAIGCRCNRYSCPFMAVHAELWVQGDLRPPPQKKAICCLWAYQMGSMQACLWVCVISSLLLCVSLFKWASWNVKRVHRRALCVHGDSWRGCVLNVSERVWVSMCSLLWSSGSPLWKRERPIWLFTSLPSHV